MVFCHNNKPVLDLSPTRQPPSSAPKSQLIGKADGLSAPPLAICPKNIFLFEAVEGFGIQRVPHGRIPSKAYECFQP